MLFNQFILSRATPTFELLFSRNGIIYIREYFAMNQASYIIASSKTRYLFWLVLRYAEFQIVCDANVNRAIDAAEDVNPILSHNNLRLDCHGRWRSLAMTRHDSNRGNLTLKVLLRPRCSNHQINRFVNTAGCIFAFAGDLNRDDIAPAWSASVMSKWNGWFQPL